MVISKEELRKTFEGFKGHGFTMEEDLKDLSKKRKWKTSEQKLKSSQKVIEKRNKVLHDQRENSKEELDKIRIEREIEEN